MTTIEQAINWMDLDKRCGGYAGHCLKCDAVLQRKFDTAESETRNALADILCSCTLEDFVKHEPLLWLVALLNTSRYEQFVAGIAKLAPYSNERAWQITRLSECNKGNWCFILEAYRKTLFKPRFHLHPTIAPLLIKATIRAGTEREDAIALLEYFEPVASAYPVLKDALPALQVERERREAQRQQREAERLIEQTEQNRIAEESRRILQARREARFREIEQQGTAAQLRALVEEWPRTNCEFPESWGRPPFKSLSSVPEDFLLTVGETLMSGSRAPWIGFGRRILHFLRWKAHSAERTTEVQRLEQVSLPDRLHAACQSQWSLTYFPEKWADEFLKDTPAISVELQTQMLGKLMRLRRRGSWRTVRQMVLRQTSA